MNTHIVTALSAAVLLAGTMVAAPSFAATHSNMAKSSKMNLAMHSLTLTKAQRKTAWKDLHSAAITETPLPKLVDKVGGKVPRSVPVKPVLIKAAHAVPALKPYDFTVAKGKLLIINPKTRKIADVISG